MSYNSKYTGQQVEALLDIVSQGGGTGGEGGEVQKTTETEILAMGFTKNEGTITEVKMNGASKGTSGVVDLGTVITEHQDISGKVDKVTGKQLSTEDFTTALKQKLDGLSNYNDTEINAAVSSLQTQLNTLVSGNANDAINSFNEIIAFLDGIKDNQDLSSIIASIEQQIASKMDKVTLANVATSGSYNDLNDKPTIPSKVSQLENDSEYYKPIHTTDSTSVKADDDTIPFVFGGSDLDLNMSLGSYEERNKLTITYNKYGGITSVNKNLVKKPSFKINEATTSKAGFMTATDKAKLDDIDMSTKQDKLVSGTNIKTINGNSILGSGNISITGGSGTITGVSANGTSIATSGVANIPAATTSKYGVTQLSSSTSSTSTTLAATPSAVKSAYDLANGKQDKLVSGTNIKTINGTSILGSGNIVIEGGSGGGSSSGESSSKEIVSVFGSTINVLEPNKIYIYESPSLIFSIDYIEEPADSYAEYSVILAAEDPAGSGGISPTIILPSGLRWAGGTSPDLTKEGLYELSIVWWAGMIDAGFNAVLTRFEYV